MFADVAASAAAHIEQFAEVDGFRPALTPNVSVAHEGFDSVAQETISFDPTVLQIFDKWAKRGETAVLVLRTEMRPSSAQQVLAIGSAVEARGV